MRNESELTIDGYVKLNQIINESLLNDMRQSSNLLKEEIAFNQSCTAFFCQNELLSSFSDSIKGLLSSTLMDYFKKKFCLNRSWLRSSYPGYNGSMWHQDTSINIIPCPIIVAIPLNDTTNNNGALRFIPRTQTLPHPIHDDFRYQSEVVCGTKAGDVILFQSALWHRGGANNTQRNRDIVFFEFKAIESYHVNLDHVKYQGFQVKIEGFF